jgi:hypothetical protein
VISVLFSTAYSIDIFLTVPDSAVPDAPHFVPVTIFILSISVTADSVPLLNLTIVNLPWFVMKSYWFRLPADFAIAAACDAVDGSAPLLLPTNSL